jgi:polyhydroxyalkanoate synthesis regulator phasin
MFKYENARIFSNELTNKLYKERPTCEKILENKDKLKWFLSEEELVQKFKKDIEELRQFFASNAIKITESFLCKIIKTKLNSININ